MISKTHIKFRVQKKTNPTLLAIVAAALKNQKWFPLAKRLSASTRQQASVNLSLIDHETKAGDTIVIPGKVLGSGTLTKKVRICALSFSASAKEKMKATKSEAVLLLEEIQKNPKAEGVNILG